MKRLLLPSSMAALACAGCSVFGPAVPTAALQIQVTPNGTNVPAAKVTWKNPKNLIASNVVFQATAGGGFSCSFGSLTSVNDAGVVNAGYGGQTALVKQWGDTAMQLMQAGAAAAAKGVAK